MARGGPRILSVLANVPDVAFFVTLARLLEARGAKVSFLSTDYTVERRAWRLGRPAPNVMHAWVPPRRPEMPTEGVSLENICRYVLAHPALEVRYLTLFGQADRLVRAYAGHFDRVRPDLVMSWNGTVPKVRAAMKLAEARGLAALYFEQGNFPGTTICDPKGVNYEGSMRDFAVPAEFNRERVEKYLERFRTRSRAKRDRGGTFGRILDGVVNFFARRSPFHPALYFDHDKAVNAKRLARRLQQQLRSTALGEILSREEFEPPERFVFLPLQVQDDTQVIVHSPLVRSMEELVDETVLALPGGVDLVVKSHPVDRGRRGYRVIEEMLEGPRYHFVHEADVFELARRASCVVTVNSTVGLEALALMKPVVVLGEAVYAGRGITVDVDDLEEYPAKLRGALDFRPDEDEVKRFLDYYIFEYSKPGDFRRPVATELAPLADYVMSRLGTRPPIP